MSIARFLEVRRPAWDRLGQLVERTGRKGVGALSEDELHEVTRLYPALALDVARARLYGLDAPTQERINRLAISAHGLLYRRARTRPLRAVARFYLSGFPRLFRRLWPYVALSAAIFGVVLGATYATIRARPSTAHLFLPPCMDMPDGQEGLSAEDMSERFRAMPKPPMAAGIMANNISIAFRAFALGITAGLGTCVVLIVNAMMLGSIAAHFANHGLAYPFWSFVTAHGVLEIMTVLIAAAAGLRLGLSLALPGRLTRGASLRAGAREAVLLVLGTVPMFVTAGAIEGFVTPTYAPGWFKIGLGITVGGAAMAYLLTVGRERPATDAAQP